MLITSAGHPSPPHAWGAQRVTARGQESGAEALPPQEVVPLAALMRGPHRSLPRAPLPRASQERSTPSSSPAHACHAHWVDAAQAPQYCAHPLAGLQAPSTLVCSLIAQALGGRRGYGGVCEVTGFRYAIINASWSPCSHVINGGAMPAGVCHGINGAAMPAGVCHGINSAAMPAGVCHGIMVTVQPWQLCGTRQLPSSLHCPPGAPQVSPVRAGTLGMHRSALAQCQATAERPGRRAAWALPVQSVHMWRPSLPQPRCALCPPCTLELSTATAWGSSGGVSMAWGGLCCAYKLPIQAAILAALPLSSLLRTSYPQPCSHNLTSLALSSSIPACFSSLPPSMVPSAASDVPPSSPSALPPAPSPLSSIFELSASTPSTTAS